MQAVAQQLVPQMTDLQKQHEVERAHLERTMRETDGSSAPEAQVSFTQHPLCVWRLDQVATQRLLTAP